MRSPLNGLMTACDPCVDRPPLPATSCPRVIACDRITSGSPRHADFDDPVLDIAKNVFQVHGIDAARRAVVREATSAQPDAGILQSAAAVPCRDGSPAPRPIIGRVNSRSLRHSVRLMPAKDVKAYVKRNKNDAADAEAICEAAATPDHAFCCRSNRPSSRPVDATSHARSFDAPADAGYQCFARAFGRARHYGCARA